MAKRLVANGAWLLLKVDQADFGLVTNLTWDENFAVQPVEVLNVLGPLTLDTTGYTCSIDIESFVPRDLSDFDRIINGKRLIPTRDEVKDDGFMPDRILSVVDTADKITHNRFERSVLSSNRKTIQANNFVTYSLSYMSTGRTK